MEKIQEGVVVDFEEWKRERSLRPPKLSILERFKSDPCGALLRIGTVAFGVCFLSLIFFEPEEWEKERKLRVLNDQQDLRASALCRSPYTVESIENCKQSLDTIVRERFMINVER